jgi:hypothetical protein
MLGMPQGLLVTQEVLSPCLDLVIVYWAAGAHGFIVWSPDLDLVILLQGYCDYKEFEWNSTNIKGLSFGKCI